MTEEQTQVLDSYFLSHYGKMLGIAVGSLGNRYKAEEAVQQVFLIASKKPDALINSPNPVGWLINTLKYVIANMRRSDFVDQRLLAKATAFHENAEGQPYHHPAPEHRGAPSTKKEAGGQSMDLPTAGQPGASYEP